MKEQIFISVTPDELQTIVKQAITEVLEAEKFERKSDSQQELSERPTRREVAAYFKKTVVWVDKKVREGKLKKYKDGNAVFFLREEVKQFALNKE